MPNEKDLFGLRDLIAKINAADQVAGLPPEVEPATANPKIPASWWPTIDAKTKEYVNVFDDTGSIPGHEPNDLFRTLTDNGATNRGNVNRPVIDASPPNATETIYQPPSRRASDAGDLPTRVLGGAVENPGDIVDHPANDYLGDFLGGYGGSAPAAYEQPFYSPPSITNTESGGSSIWLILGALAGIGLLAYTYYHNKHKGAH